MFRLAISSLCLFVCAGAASGSQTFPDGVAAGEIRPNAALLWTRAGRTMAVTVEVATGAGFAEVLATRRTVALGINDYAAKVYMTGLAPDTRYYYRWRHGERVSATGVFRTPPRYGAAAPLSLSWSGAAPAAKTGAPAQDNATVLDAVARVSPTVHALLGAAPDEAAARKAEAPYRRVLREAAVSLAPGARGEGGVVRLTGEPIHAGQRLVDASCTHDPLYRRYAWGDDVEVYVLDDLACRSPSVRALCGADPAPLLAAAQRRALGLAQNPPEGCREALRSSARTMLGPVQKARFTEALRRSPARFKLVFGSAVWSDLGDSPYQRWEGYAAERDELLRFIGVHDIDGVVFLTSHPTLSFSARLRGGEDFAAITATEFVTASGAPAPELAGTAAPARALCASATGPAWGVVNYDPAAATLAVQLRDATGRALHDGGGGCAVVLGDGAY